MASSLISICSSIVLVLSSSFFTVVSGPSSLSEENVSEDSSSLGKLFADMKKGTYSVRRLNC